jgi:hypothetical protein
MQPILAESAPRPGRFAAIAVALAVVASLVMMPTQHRSRHREHHQLPRLGKCMHGYTYIAR